MKKIISYFIKYHVAVNIIILAVVIFGYLGTKSMKSSFFPLTESQFINISVVYPGASPQEMEEGVVLKIEDNLKGLVGIDRACWRIHRASAPLLCGRHENGGAFSEGHRSWQ